jgi:predicted transposase YbfD/YdcC
MAAFRAPKQWSLTTTETITSIEAWENNLKYILSLDHNFASFLTADATWLKKTNASPLRGFTNDAEDIPQIQRRNAAQKVTHLEMMLGQIANYAPVISRNTIVRNSTSISGVWQAIRQHYGLQSTGSRFLDLANIKSKLDQRPEDLYQCLMFFVEDNLLTAVGGITHHGITPEADEELSPSLENFIVVTWLQLLHPDLPRLVKQRYDTEHWLLSSLRYLKPWTLC